jgi:MATE family multidrug resistance protein
MSHRFMLWFSQDGRSAWGEHYHSTITLAIPLIIGQVAMIGIWTADIVMMGGISADALAAGTQANRLYQPLYFLALGLTIAVSPLTAQALGAKRRRIARRVMRQGLWLALIYAVITIIPMWHGEDLLIALGQDVGLAKDADLFLKMLAPGIIPTYFYFVFRQYILAHKRPLMPVVANLLGVGLNIFLNGVFIHGYFGMPELGFAGIGLATSLTFTFMAASLALCIHTQKPFSFTRPFARFFRFDTEIMWRLFTVGLPIGVTLLAETGMFIIAGLYIGVYGKIAVAASGIATQIAATAYMVPLAIGQASTIRVGHEAGAGDAQNVIRAATSALVVTLAITSFLTVILLIWTEDFINAFLNFDDLDYQDVVALAVPMVLVVALFQVVDGLQAVLTSVLRGINDTKWPAVISVFSYWCVGLLSGVVLAEKFGWGPVGVFWGLFLGLAVGCVLLFIRGLNSKRKINATGRIMLA